MGGNSVKYTLSNKTWVIGMVGLDTKSITNEFVAAPIVSNSPLESGGKIPDDGSYSSCNWELDN